MKTIKDVTHTPTPFTLGRINALLNERFNTEDAAFIVRAVNVHEELLEALLHAHGELDNLNPNDHDGALYCQCETARTYQRFAKAEGK